MDGDEEVRDLEIETTALDARVMGTAMTASDKGSCGQGRRGALTPRRPALRTQWFEIRRVR